MKYSEYQVSDFLRDEFFVKWVKEDDPHVDDFWKKWIATHPEKIKIITEAKGIILSLQYDELHELPVEDYLNMYEEVLKKSDFHFFRETPRNSIGYIAKIAASVLLIAILSFIVWNQANQKVKTPLSVVSNNTINKSTLPGQKLSFKLPDGSSVKLNASSRLSFSQPVDSSKREVFLEGEAFFEVVKDLKRPFIVSTHGLSTTALGTSFNISAYGIEDSHKVSLVTGSVKVEKLSANSTDKPKILLPGDQVIYNRELDQIHKSRFDGARDLAWRKGTLVFKNTNFSSVIRTLERWYGVQFEIINESKKSKDVFSGVFANENLEIVLEILSYSGGFTFKMKGEIVTIEFLDKK